MTGLMQEKELDKSDCFEYNIYKNSGCISALK